MKAERMLPEMGDGLTFRAEEKKGGLVDSGWGGPERNQPGRAHPGAGARGHLEEPWATVSGQLRGWTGAGSGGARWWPCGGGECWACRHPAPPPRPPQVLFNVAVVQSQLGLWAEAACSLGDAISKVPEGACNDLDIALGQVQVRGRRGEPGS